MVIGRRGEDTPPLRMGCKECGARSAGGQRRPPLRRTMSFLPPGRCGHRPPRKRYKGGRGERNPPVTASPCQPPLRQGGLGDGGCGCSCCGAQNFHAALRRTLEILTAATRSPRFFCHRQRSVRSPHRPARTCTAPLVKNRVIARPVRKLAVAIRNPRPLGPFA